MSKRIANISNLLELIGNNSITLASVQCRTKAFADITETENVSLTEFLESLEYLNESKLFKDSVDFYYEFSGKNSIRIECGMKTPYLNECFYANCVIKGDISTKEIEAKLRETIFDKMDEKIAV